MLPLIQISGNITATYQMLASATAYVLGKHASIKPSGMDGIVQVDGLSNDILTIKGQVDCGAAGLDAGITLHGKDSTVMIEKTGFVQAFTGILSGGYNHVIENHGTLTANDRAIWFQSNGTVENYGRIFATNDAVISGGVHSVNIVNHAGGVIASDSAAIHIAGGYNTASTVTNDGLITGKGAWAFISAWGAETVINHGVMRGSILMGEGDDTFDNRGGKVDSDIKGQIGNDTLITDDAKVRLAEEAGEGSDTVKSTVTYVLNDNVENLFLLGRRDIDGTGNDGANYLSGNKGDNTLSGFASNDILNGGRGDDVLTGGADADIFIFQAHGGRDVVTDFLPGVDKINLVGQNAIADFADLMADHAAFSHGNVEIHLNGKDVLVLENIDLDDLSMSDFLF